MDVDSRKDIMPQRCIMNGSRNLVISFVITVALHGVIVLGVATLVMVGTAEVVPAFKQGISSVVITIDQPAAPAAVPVVTIQKDIPGSIPMKPEIRPIPKVETTKAITHPSGLQAKPVVSRCEEAKPVVAVKPEEDYSILEDEMFHGDLFADEPENAAYAQKKDDADESLIGAETDSGVKVFASSESFVDIHPSYPIGARMRGEEGIVVVRVTVSPSGRAESVEVMKSSGYVSLDGSAINAIKRARFVAKNGGVINGGQVTLPFRFKLVN